MNMQVVRTQKPSGQDNLTHFRVNKIDEKSIHVFVNDAQVLSILFENEIPESKSGDKIVNIGHSRKRKGLYITQHFCPKEVLNVLTGDEEKDMLFLKQVFECFQKVYPKNNSNYGFNSESYKAMLRRFFVMPNLVQNAGKGPDLTHYFMELPEDYVPYNEK